MIYNLQKSKYENKQNLEHLSDARSVSNSYVFTSCSSDDDGDGSKDINVQEVVGTWTCTASTDKVDGNL